MRIFRTVSGKFIAIFKKDVKSAYHIISLFISSPALLIVIRMSNVTFKNRMFIRFKSQLLNCVHKLTI